MKEKEEDIAYFGFKPVTAREKSAKVSQVFTSVATQYDLMNDVMSFGIHRLWKRFALFLANIRPGQKVLDLAAGTGDLSHLLIPLVGDEGEVLIADINAAMLNANRERLLDEGFGPKAKFIQANAEQLPFKDNYFDCICIAFGLRNITHIPKALLSMYHALKPTGQVIILEFSKPTSSLWQTFYDLYSFHVLPKLGEWIANDKESYQYLVESIRMHPDQKNLKKMMEEAGFAKCEYFNLTQGVVAIHRGFKF
jgi:demethylmenaquinone methyltransferase / 2-methoxy-6-polyprenyl-1,4-benzoquinol methylase